MPSDALARSAQRLQRSRRRNQIAANGDRLEVVLVAASPTRRAELADALVARPVLRLTASVPSLTQVLQEVQIASGVILLDSTAHKSRDAENRQLENLEALLENPALSALLLVDNADLLSLRTLLKIGNVGLLSADASASEIETAIMASASGLVILDPEIASQIAEGLPRDLDDSHEPVEELTRREIEVLGLLARGFGNKQIAARLGISEHTAKFHISSILGKLAVSSRTEAVTQGLRRGLILL